MIALESTGRLVVRVSTYAVCWLHEGMTACEALHSGHGKTVSYVRYLKTTELVSASTDSTLRLWETQACTAGRVFSCHNYEEHLVGLSVDGEFAACDTASEVNSRTCLRASAMTAEVHRQLP